MPPAVTHTFSPNSPQELGSVSLNPLEPSAKIIVVGAGAFGSWAAYSLLKKGYKVTLVDAWGPGHSRSSSGDETRVIRSTYGSNETYFDLNVKALGLWKDFETRINRRIFHNTGVLWFCYDEKTSLVDDSIPFAKKHRMDYEYLSLAELKKRFPLIHSSDLHHAWFDPYGGYLNARESIQLLNQIFIQDGGEYM